MTGSIKACLACLGEIDFTECIALDQEWSVIKKAYFKKILVAHPDKGGDSDSFRKIQTSFELLREIYEKKEIVSFSSNLSSGGNDFHETSFDDLYSDIFTEFANKKTPSYAFYEEAAEENVPTYRVELAKSGRSRCSRTKTASAKKCSPHGQEAAFIDKGEIRFGSINVESGSYGRWIHLQCWRVPALIWRGLPQPESPDFTSQNIARALATMNEVAFCGFSELSEEDKAVVVEYIMDTSNWAASREIKPGSKPSPMQSSSSTPSSSAHKASSATAPSAALVRQDLSGAGDTPSSSALTQATKVRQLFVPPRPGQNGAKPHALTGKTFVLTGSKIL